MAAAPIRRMRSAAGRAAAPAPAPAPSFKETPRRRRVEEVQASGRVSTQMKVRGDVIDETDREVPPAPRRFEEGQHPAYVKVGAGMTLNLGNFESLRVDCSITLPCLPDEADAAYEEASAFVYERITEEQARWLPGQAPSKKGGR